LNSVLKTKNEGATDGRTVPDKSTRFSFTVRERVRHDLPWRDDEPQ